MYQSTGPLMTRPQSPNADVATFPDVDTRNSQSVEAIVVDECAALIISGKKGGIKGVIWISPEDSLALADMLNKRYR